MNAERFHAIVRALDAELDATNLKAALGELAAATRQLAGDPAQVPTQQQVAQIRNDLENTLRDAQSNDFSPAWREALDELGVSDLLGEALAEQIEATFSRNEITPATAADEIEGLQNRITNLAEAIGQARMALDFFQVGAENLDPGEFEIGFLIPRQAVQDGLGALGEEFRQLKKILGPFTELADEGRPDLRIRSLSSSEFQVFLESTPVVAASIAAAIDRLLAAYERILNIRQKRKELAENEDVPDEVLEPLAQHANSLMEAEIELIVDEIVVAAKLADQGRLNELRNELRLSLNALATRVDQGYNIEVRAGELPPVDEEGEETDVDPETRDAAEKVRETQKRLEFMNITGKPILSLDQPDPPPEEEEKAR